MVAGRLVVAGRPFVVGGRFSCVVGGAVVGGATVVVAVVSGAMVVVVGLLATELVVIDAVDVVVVDVVVVDVVVVETAPGFASTTVRSRLRPTTRRARANTAAIRTVKTSARRYLLIVSPPWRRLIRVDAPSRMPVFERCCQDLCSTESSARRDVTSVTRAAAPRWTLQTGPSHPGPRNNCSPSSCQPSNTRSNGTERGSPTFDSLSPWQQAAAPTPNYPRMAHICRAPGALPLALK